jgi:CRP-like cAMP-binding protein
VHRIASADRRHRARARVVVAAMETLESVLANLSLFEGLRADEIGRVARKFAVDDLAAGAVRDLGDGPDEARLVIVVNGRVALDVETGGTRGRSILEPGDRYGEMALLSGYARAVHVVADEASTIATIDRAGFDALLAEFPAIALPLADELSRELHAKNDAVRELLELHAEELPKEELAGAIDERRRVIARAGARVARLSPRALFRKLVTQQGAEPPFWILIGFIVSLGLARLVVYMILKYHLEKQLFALVPGNDPNPMHVHHFNYGLMLIGTAGLAALLPFGRRALRVLAFVFGFGCGLVFDEFALIWNLNPEYANPSSLIACGVAAAVLVQMTYFRRFWRAVARRAYLSMRSGR